jgi:hypothetical protein
MHERTACLVAPLCLPFILAPYFTFTKLGPPGWVIFSTAVITAFGYLGTFALLLPSYRYLTAKGFTGILVSLLCGFVAALITAAVLMWSIAGLLLGGHWLLAATQAVRKPPEVQDLPGFALIGSIGMMVGAIFWLIARPDQSSRERSR